MQHRGPPIPPIRSRDRAVIRWETPQASPARGVDPDTMDANMPALSPAPQAPQNPQAPPGTPLPRLSISPSALSSSTAPPALRKAVSRAAPTMTWCSGPCMWQKGWLISFSIISRGSALLSARQMDTIWSMPWVWQSLHT